MDKKFIMIQNQPEVWLRGPVAGVPSLLQPVAHALLQAQEEIHALMEDFPENLLWEKPAGVASVGFHLQHLTGVLDRLFTYAKGEQLSQTQLQYLKEESLANDKLTTKSLLERFDKQLAQSLEQLKKTDANELILSRMVGRKQLPSTVVGLLFHSAEHTMRHTGQLLVTVRVLKAGNAA
jgi:uncharacterized damage-inducible protein DinB